MTNRPTKNVPGPGGPSPPDAPGAVAQENGLRHPQTPRSVSEWGLLFAGAAAAAVHVQDEAVEELRLVETVGSTAALQGLPLNTPLTSSSPLADAFRAGRPLWCSAAELAAYRNSGPVTLPADISLGVLPLAAGGRRLGCLLVVEEAEDAFDAERRQFLELYADQVAVQLVGVQPEGDEEPAAAGGAGAGRAAQRFAPDPALGRLGVGSFSLVPSAGRIDADAQALELLDIPSDDFDGRLETLLAHTLPDDLPALMSLAASGQMIFGGRELEFRIRRAGGELRWLRLRCRARVAAGDGPKRVLGVVTDISYLRPSADDASDVHRLSAALEGATTIRDVSRAVVTALRRPLRADRLALAALEADRLVVSVLDPPDPSAWPEVWQSDWRSEWPDAPIAALPTLRAALHEGHATLRSADSSPEPGLAGIGPGGLAILPLPADGRVAGVCLIGWDEPHTFGPEERTLLTAAACLVGQALVRAHALDAEHELATMLQRSLLPRTLPALDGGVAVARYLPATGGLEVGGDWYDVIPLEQGHVALVIGDVQGHSAAAATIMGQIRTAIRAYAVEGHPPDVVISHANRLLVGMATDLFATCTYVELDIEEGNLWCVRAGHLPPLVRHPDGSSEEIEVEGGLPLGVHADAEFPLVMAGLAPGSVLTLVTDGLVESASLDFEDGMRRAGDVLSAADPSDAERVADDLLGGSERRADDVALLLLRYDGMKVRPIRTTWAVWRLPDAVMHARRFTARTLRSWKADDELDVVLLVVSELVTNAMVHTQGEVRLDLTLIAEERLRVAVTDASPRAPAKPVAVGWESTGGRGLLLVEAMTESWGSVPVSGGKQVWGEVALPPRQEATAGGGASDT
ncbi:SpoIIE family protein phosphatase [Streptomyces sp. NPDC050315]|uniref:SpoIIE family protein phosphatase n=1 Tax=Streptomyces sp. NPDC050315 TaxID=3155039 RepID=UPI00343CF19F